MPTSLVTGGAGFIGSHVAEHLLKAGHHVTVLDDLSGGQASNVPVGDFVVGSILDDVLIRKLFETRKFDYIFHLAAYAAENLSHHIRRFNYETNVIGSVNLINAAVNAGSVRRFVFASSAAVYGHREGVAREDSCCFPADPYGVAKLAVEHDLYCARAYFGLPFTIFRMHNVYGERQNLTDPYRNVIGIFMRQALRGEPMTIYGDGEQSRQFTYIDDVAPSIARSVEIAATADQIFNIGSKQAVTVNGIAAYVAEAINLHAEKVHLPQRREVRNVWLDHRKFEQAFEKDDWTPAHNGIARMAAWAKTQPLGASKPFEGIEIEQGLPEVWRVK